MPLPALLPHLAGQALLAAEGAQGVCHAGHSLPAGPQLHALSQGFLQEHRCQVFGGAAAADVIGRVLTAALVALRESWGRGACACVN